MGRQSVTIETKLNFTLQGCDLKYIIQNFLLKFLFVLLSCCFSTAAFAQLDPLPPIIPNPNRGLPQLYSIADNRSELYYVAPDPTAVPLPSPQFIDITFGGSPITFSGEGGGFRSTDQLIYVFRDAGGDSSDMYSIDPNTGIANLVKTDIVGGHVEGAEFYINNDTGEEILVIIHTLGGDHAVTAVNPNASGPNPAWSYYAGYPIIMSGDRDKADGISWDPVSANFYVQNDDTVDYYTLDISTGVTTYAFRSELAVDGEGITYASDGKNYIEDEGQAGHGRMLYSVDVPTGTMVPVAELGSTGDVEAIMGNLGVRNDAGDAPSSYGYAAHQLPVLTGTPVSVYLGGSAPDSEDPFVNFSLGQADDDNGDDEDGVFSDGFKLDGQLFNLGETKTIDITTAGAGLLNAWIDFNRDGDFDDAGEQIANDVSPSGGSITLSVPVPPTASPGATYARFRYSSEAGLAAGNTEAQDGEVEDYQVILRDETLCGPKETQEEYFTYTPVYASSVILDDSVSNEDNALGNDPNTVATLNSDGDEFILEMSEQINTGDEVTVYGTDGSDLNIWISSSATGPWTQVANNGQLDFTFTSPGNWLYIRFTQPDDIGDEEIAYIEANKAIANYRCVADNDGDTVPDRTDLDDDNDGIPDTEENGQIINNDQPACGGETSLDFSAAATLESGTALSEGAVYRIPGITTGTDALITIAETNNVSVTNIDNNATSPSSFKPQTAFNFPNEGDDGYVEYLIQFVNSGGSSPVVINKFFMNFNDIDGGANYAETNWADNPATYTIDNPTELTMGMDGSWVIATGSIIDHSGSTNSDPEVNFAVNYNSKSEIRIRVGALARVDGASSGGRQHSIEFNCITNYVSPVTYGIDLDSDGIANHLDLDSDNDGIYDAVEAGHAVSHSDGILNGSFGPNGLSDAVETNAESGILNYTIVDSDATTPANYLQLDSDGDGCSDANEAYADANADGGDDGYYGLGIPATDIRGRVASASYITPADNGLNGTPDYTESTQPTISADPADTTACLGCNSSFTATADSSDTYQWQYFDAGSWVDLAEGGIFSGVTTTTLNLTGITASEQGRQFRLISSNSNNICAVAASDFATLTIQVNTVISNRRITYRINRN